MFRALKIDKSNFPIRKLVKEIRMYANLHFTTNDDVAMIRRVGTIERGEESFCFESYHSKGRFGEVHCGEHDLEVNE